MAKNQCFAIFREANSFEYKRAMYTKPDRGLNISVAWNQEQGGFFCLCGITKLQYYVHWYLGGFVFQISTLRYPQIFQDRRVKV